jgi:hypothetical protein
MLKDKKVNIPSLSPRARHQTVVLIPLWGVCRGLGMRVVGQISFFPVCFGSCMVTAPS